MMTVEATTEYCTIEARVQDDGRDPGRGGHKLMWLQFVAVKQNGKHQTIISRSEKIPLANMIGAASFSPDRNLIAHVNTYENFLLKLKKAKWEVASKNNAAWWQTQLKRPAPAKRSLRDRLGFSRT